MDSRLEEEERSSGNVCDGLCECSAWIVESSTEGGINRSYSGSNINCVQ